MATKKRSLKPLPESGVYCALYARVSTEEQARGASIGTQLSELETYAAAQGWHVAATFTDGGTTGTIDERDGLDRLLLAAALSPIAFQVVVSTVMDRLGRGLPSAFIERDLGKLGVHVRYVHQDFSGQTASDYLLREGQRMMDGWLPAVIRDTTIRHMEQLFRDGYYVGGSLSFGFITVPDPAGRFSRHQEPLRRLALDEARCRIVRQVFQAAADGHGVGEVRRILLASGGPTSYQGAAALLRNRNYLGELSWRGLTRQDSAFGIVAPDLFARAQKTLQEAEKPARVSASGLPQLPLLGRIFCPCGRLMSSYWTTGQRGGKFEYYRCQRSSCRPRQINARRVHRAILSEFVAVGSVPWRARLAASKLSVAASQQEDAVKRLRDAQRAVERVSRELSQLVNTAAILQSEAGRARLAQQIDRAAVLESHAKAERDALQQELDRGAGRYSAARLQEIFGRLPDVLAVATEAEKNKLVELLVCRVEVGEGAKTMLVEVCGEMIGKPTLICDESLSGVRTEVQAEGGSGRKTLTSVLFGSISNPSPLRLSIPLEDT